ncbi:hypothetical protein VTK26DRAFT_4600 [Humicola hyalothermophila]
MCGRCGPDSMSASGGHREMSDVSGEAAMAGKTSSVRSNPFIIADQITKSKGPKLSYPGFITSTTPKSTPPKKDSLGNPKSGRRSSSHNLWDDAPGRLSHSHASLPLRVPHRDSDRHWGAGKPTATQQASPHYPVPSPTSSTTVNTAIRVSSHQLQKDTSTTPNEPIQQHVPSPPSSPAAAAAARRQLNRERARQRQLSSQDSDATTFTVATTGTVARKTIYRASDLVQQKIAALSAAAARNGSPPPIFGSIATGASTTATAEAGSSNNGVTAATVTTGTTTAATSAATTGEATAATAAPTSTTPSGSPTAIALTVVGMEQGTTHPAATAATAASRVGADVDVLERLRKLEESGAGRWFDRFSLRKIKSEGAGSEDVDLSAGAGVDDGVVGKMRPGGVGVWHGSRGCRNGKREGGDSDGHGQGQGSRGNPGGKLKHSSGRLDTAANGNGALERGI